MKTAPSTISRAGTWAAVGAVLAAGVLLSAKPTRAADPPPAKATTGQASRPNILVIMGDDIGQSNISVFTRGLMGYQTPNIDRIAHEGLLFTDYYAEQSCTAGRSTFIMGQCGLRTGLSRVGLPAARVGMQKEDPTIAELLKPLGYATGQFGKNHLGDRNEYLPTVHGFNEFFGNLYHLNAEEEPEYRDYPQIPRFRMMFGPRGVLRCKATDVDDPTVDPRFGKVGRQTVEDTGPLTQKRMETIDDETSAAAIDFIKRQAEAGQPFFVWFNPTRMHLWTHVRPEHRGPKGVRSRTEYADGMVEHDATVGTVLKTLDDLGIAGNTIVIYTTDNGAHANSWPDAATTPFRGEKNTNWEGGYRVPAFVRWPGHIAPGSVSNEIVSGMDWLPTLLAAAGDPNIKQELLNGYTVGGVTYKVHLDGYNLLPYLTGQEKQSPRREFLYFSDEGDVLGLRYEDWKWVLAEQRMPGTMGVWLEPFTHLRIPKLYNLRSDPYERADITSNTYYDWYVKHMFLNVPAMAYLEHFLESFKEFPPRQRPEGLSIQRTLETMQKGAVGQ
ncbi:MAG: arylsulfatase [Acidobacteriia bacterium]|nr:arylsulfatase [Terriglobia bacterium]